MGTLAQTKIEPLLDEDGFPIEYEEKVLSKTLEIVSEVFNDYDSITPKNLGKIIKGHALCKSVTLSKEKKHCFFTITDGNNTANCVIWNFEDFKITPPTSSDIVEIYGEVILDQDKTKSRIKIISLNKDITGKFDYIKTDIQNKFNNENKEQIEEDKNKLFEYIHSVKDKTCRQLLEIVFNRKDVKELFFICPGASSHHHAFRGGLLRHIIEVIETGLAILESNKKVPYNRGFFITIAIIHDMGKIYDYEFIDGAPQSTIGRSLCDHMQTGIEIISSCLREIGITIDLNNQYRMKWYEFIHAIESHHGKKDWGSFIPPKYYEASVLHIVDNMSAKITVQNDMIQQARKNNQTITEYSRDAEGHFYAGVNINEEE